MLEIVLNNRRRLQFSILSTKQVLAAAADDVMGAQPQ